MKGHSPDHGMFKIYEGFTTNYRRNYGIISFIQLLSKEQCFCV